MEQFDVIVIGGGVLGCFAARNLCRWNIKTALLEAGEDVCTGITRANTAIVYPGYDNKPGSLKAALTVAANAKFEALCKDLEVPFVRCGSLMVSFGPKGDTVLQKKLEQGRTNGVPGLRLLTGDEAREMEPMLSGSVTGALYAPTTGTVNPWQLGIAAWENAAANGCRIFLKSPVSEIRKTERGYVVRAGEKLFDCKMILNCAGIHAQQVQELVYPSQVQLRLDGTDFLVMERSAPGPKHILFQEAEEGKGITAVPCVEGNLLLESPARPLEEPFATTREGLEFIREASAQVIPGVDMTRILRSFGAVRPNPHMSGKKNIPDFSIERAAPNFYSLTGIKTPGLTCADELGAYLAQKCAGYLESEENASFEPHRVGIPADVDREIVCQCEGITRSQVVQAIARGAVTVDGVKRRLGTGMGICQGSRCSLAIEKLLEESRNGTI